MKDWFSTLAKFRLRSKSEGERVEHRMRPGCCGNRSSPSRLRRASELQKVSGGACGKKTVRWKPDLQLVQIKYFDWDPTERAKDGLATRKKIPPRRHRRRRRKRREKMSVPVQSSEVSQSKSSSDTNLTQHWYVLEKESTERLTVALRPLSIILKRHRNVNVSTE